MNGRWKAFVLFMLLGLMAGQPGWAAEIDEGTFKKIEANLMCTDGCGMYLVACDNATAQRMRSEIREKLAEGATANQIYAYMISIYGEEVMAAPPPSVPFNLMAWVMPFILIVGGGLVIYLVLDRWVFYHEARKPVRATRDPVSAVEMESYEELLDEEMKKYY